MIIPEPVKRLSLRDYHGTRGRWGSSRIKTFRQNPRLAHGLWVSNPRKWKPSPSSGAQVTGSATHDLIAKVAGEPSNIYGIKQGRTIELADKLPNTRRDGLYKDLIAEYPDKLVLTRSEYDDAVIVTEAILDPQTPAAVFAKSLLTSPGGYSELYNAWTETFMGADGKERSVDLMQLVDRLTTICDPNSMDPRFHEPYPAHVELKTVGGKDDRSVSDPAEFFYTCRRFDYDSQMAFNLRGETALLGVEPIGYFVLVETKPPYGVSVVRAGTEILDGTKGRRGRLSARLELDVTLKRLAVALEDTTGAAWAMPHERLEYGIIPELEAR